MATPDWSEYVSRADSLAPYSTTELSDALVKLDQLNGGYIPDIFGVQSGSVKLCGPAYTVRVVHAYDIGPVPNVHYLDDAPNSAVIVISAPQG